MFIVETNTKRVENNVIITRQRFIQTVIAIALLYFLFVIVQIPLLFNSSFNELSLRHHPQITTTTHHHRHALQNRAAAAAAAQEAKPSPTRPEKQVFLSGLQLDPARFETTESRPSDLHGSARNAVDVGRQLWSEIGEQDSPAGDAPGGPPEACPVSAAAAGAEFGERGNVMEMPCGMTLGSSVTVVGKPRKAGGAEAAEFKVELVGLKAVEGEEPPRVLHLNPRLKGDWSGRPVIEMNTCYRMQWGPALRCEGWESRPDEETVDGNLKCEKWIQGDTNNLEATKATWWLNKLIGSRTKKLMVNWPFPFTEEKLFVLTISARLEGYHVNVDGRHVASFPYRPGFILEDATGISVSEDVDVHSVYAASLPSTHPTLASQRSLEMSSQWRAPPVPEGEVELFIGVLSAGNHFPERMAVRKSWMQHRLIQSSNVVARFFVALNARKEVNAQLKKEAEFFGDMVIVPYLDNYDLVVLKTIAICEHGVQVMSAKHIMKCDDDTFINLDVVLSEVRNVPRGQSFYIGNINYYHKPLRYGKWAVTHEEWPEEDYPPYANGPGYIMSSDLANFTVSEFRRNKLRLFKMEDVSMGMWVEKFNSTKPVQYIHNEKFCQFGCVEGYFTAHYQSPRQMICMWDKLQSQARTQCCNMR